MPYTFARVQCHPKIPNLSAWYLVVRAADKNLLNRLHESVTRTSFTRILNNPHMQTDMARYSPLANLYNPIRQGAGWLNTAITGLFQFGAIYVNQNHGMMFGEQIILEERVSSDLKYPDEEAHKEGIKIKVHRWAMAKHYYLSSSDNRIFSQPKYNTLEAAMNEARRHAFEANILVSDELAYGKAGD